MMVILWQHVKKLTTVEPEQYFVDRGYRCYGIKEIKVFISGQKRGVSRSIKKALKRIEPEIVHMKNDGRLDRCYLKGAVGDDINIIMVAAGHNLRMTLNKLRLLWLKFMFSVIRSFISLSKPTVLNQELFPI